MGFFVMLWGAEKLVPAEYWCPYGTFALQTLVHNVSYKAYIVLSRIGIF